MNSDITFCANHQHCKKASSCRRAQYPKDIDLSWSDFWKEDQDCGAYWSDGTTSRVETVPEVKS